MSKDTMRMVIGFGVVLVILIIWQFAFRPKPRQAPPVPPPDTVAETAPAETVPPAPVEPEPEPKPEPALALPPALEADSSLAEASYVLENDEVRLEFTNVGGAIRSAFLKRYDAELIPDTFPAFAAALLTPAGVVDLSNVPMQATERGGELTFRVGGDSLSLVRKFSLGEGYDLALETKTVGADGHVVLVDGGIAITEQKAKDDLPHYHFYARTDEKLHRFAGKSLKKEAKATRERSDWVGLKTKYFFTAMVNEDPGFDSSYATALEDGRIGFSATVRPEDGESEVVIYLGPLEYDRLRSYGLGFENAVSLGWAKPIALGILWLLKFLYRIFGNWGVAIIVFSILMKAIFFPLTRTQTKQMRRMQMLQPKLNELKQKYKNDSQALNQETMQLYKLYKINPLSGCLPMLVQLPVFWALYSVLRTFIDLRGASFVLWLKDLSQPDALFGHLPFFGNPPIGLLPILMGVSFIAQNMLTSTDKKNWALTIIFPIFITVIFLNFPSGLQLYWFMYNVLSILESVIGLRGGKKWLKKKPTKEQSLTKAPTG